MNDIEKWLHANMGNLVDSAYYLGDEINTYHRPWEETVFKVALVSTMGYYASDGNRGIPLLYELLNKRFPNWSVERAYMPNCRPDAELFERNRIRPFSLESHRELIEFDVVGFSVLNYFAYLHIPYLLYRSRLTLWVNERTEDHPIIMIGGSVVGGCEILAGGKGGVFDLAFMGEAEDELPEVLTRIEQMRREKVPRKVMFASLAREFRFLYAPSLYEVSYAENGSTVSRRPLVPRIPDTVNKVHVPDLDRTFIPTDPIVSYVGSGNEGCVEISRGCTASCHFCSESFWFRPYRERSAQVVIDAVEKMRRNGGVVDPILMSFSATDYSHRRELLKGLLEMSSRVKMLAVRADTYAADPLFASYIHRGDKRPVTIGVEGVSERIRRKLNKCVSTDQILSAVRLAFENEVPEVKFFFIANVPGVETGDFLEFVNLLEVVNAVKKDFSGDVTLSFSPLIVSPFTPFQWYGSTIDQRTTMPWIPKIKELGYNFRIGMTGKYDASYVDQLLHLGDRRITSMLVRSSVVDRILFYSMIPKGTKRKWESFLRTMNLSFESYFAPKPEEYVFPWDFIDTGVKKKVLLNQYRESLEDKSEGVRCLQRCYGCGACGPEIWKQRKRNGDDISDEELKGTRIAEDRAGSKFNWVRVRMSVDALHRMVPLDSWRTRIRRASNRLGYDIDPDRIIFMSSRIEQEDIAWGDEYVDIGFVGVSPALSRFVPDLNREMGGGVWVTDGIKLGRSAGTPKLRGSYVCSMYEIHPAENVANASIRLKTFLDLPPVPPGVEFPNKGRGKKFTKEVRSKFREQYPTTFIIPHKTRWGVENLIVDFRPRLLDGVVGEDGTIHLLIRGGIAVKDMFRRVFGVPEKIASRAKIQRLISYFPGKDEDDLLASTCEVCGRGVECDLLGHPVSPAYCARHLLRFLSGDDQTLRQE